MFVKWKDLHVSKRSHADKQAVQYFQIILLSIVAFQVYLRNQVSHTHF